MAFELLKNLGASVATGQAYTPGKSAADIIKTHKGKGVVAASDERAEKRKKNMAYGQAFAGNDQPGPDYTQQREEGAAGIKSMYGDIMKEHQARWGGAGGQANQLMGQTTAMQRMAGAAASRMGGGVGGGFAGAMRGGFMGGMDQYANALNKHETGSGRIQADMAEKLLANTQRYEGFERQDQRDKERREQELINSLIAAGDVEGLQQYFGGAGQSVGGSVSAQGGGVRGAGKVYGS